VCLRLYTRWTHLHTITKSDWIILVAYFTFCLTVVIDSLSSAQGFFGKDVTYNSDLSQVLHNPKELTKLLKVSQSLVLCFYIKLFTPKCYKFMSWSIQMRNAQQVVVTIH